jgi:hypothetical protein
MKILNSYRFGKGAKDDESQIPALIPPKDQKLNKSISIAESIDIICEGPIYGLVDQFGKKVYGLDMLKGIYLNGNAVMNSKGEYNYRNILMEINLGTENQKPLPSFKYVSIPKAVNFKLLGPIKNSYASGQNPDVKTGPNPDQVRDFVRWGRAPKGDWPSEDKDPFVFIHKIRNRDVSKVKISLLVEKLNDTVDIGEKGKAGSIGTIAQTSITLRIKHGLESSNIVTCQDVTIWGSATSPFAYMLGENEETYSAPWVTDLGRSSSVGGMGPIGGTTSSASASATRSLPSSIGSDADWLSRLPQAPTIGQYV